MNERPSRETLQALAHTVDREGGNLNYDRWEDCMREVYPALVQDCDEQDGPSGAGLHARTFRLTVLGCWGMLDEMEWWAIYRKSGRKILVV